MNAKLRLIGDERMDKIAVPVEAATVIAAGDLISYESGYAVKLDAQAEDASFIGVAETASPLNETTPLTVITKGVFEVAVASAAYTIGLGLHYNTGGYLESATANTLGWAWQDSGGVSVSTLHVLFDAPALRKLFPTVA